MPLKGHPTTWAEGSKIAVIRDAIDGSEPHVKVPLFNRDGEPNGFDCIECKRAARTLYDSVGTEPLIFKSEGKVLPQGKKRWSRFMNEVREIHAYIARGEWSGEDEPQGPSEPMPEPEPTPVPAPSEPTPEPTPVPSQGPGEAKVRADVAEYRVQVQTHRAYARARDLECLDSMRIMIDGVKAILNGVPVAALISSIQAPWADLTRDQFRNFTPTREQLQPVIPSGSYDYAGFAPRPSEFAHGVSEYVSRLVEANIPTWLHGPAGTGKSSAAKYAAEQFAQKNGLIGRKECEGRYYFEVNLAGAMVSAVKGRDRLQEIVESDFMLAYEHGGTVCLEEFDSSHPTVGTFLGTALASPDGFSNDILGRFVPRHPLFRCIVTANSLGYGDAKFKRQDLDAATKDRFRMGRVYTGLDITLEQTIVDSIVNKYFGK